tara:strand:+ start:34 stop:450 length:417 start_codon:yes stop_codon:yes gene_type:complete
MANWDGLFTGGATKLAPDLTYPAGKAGGNNLKDISGIDASSGLTTVLSLTGKFAISYIAFTNQTTELNTYKLTIDGVVVWSNTHTATTATDVFLGSVTQTGSSWVSDTIITCEQTFLLEVQTATDTSINLQYLARPIL